MDMIRELDERLVVSTATYETELSGLRMGGRHKMDIIEMKYLRSMCEVTRLNRQTIKEVGRRADVIKK